MRYCRWNGSNNAVAHWKFDETAGAVAQDSSPNGYGGTLMNMDDSDWVADVNGNAQFAPYDPSDTLLPSDHYPWLTGEVAKMLTGELTPTPTMPTR